MKLRSSILLMVLILVSEESGFACPVYIFPRDYEYSEWLGLREQLALYRLDHSKWVAQPMQIDIQDKRGRFVLPNLLRGKRHKKHKRLLRSDVLLANDRITFDSSAFGNRKGRRLKMPCGATRGFEVETKSGFAYLFFCRVTDVPDGDKTVAGLDEGKRLVDSSVYSFHYSARNPILFEKINLVPDLNGGHSADFRIRSDVIRFFTLNFESDDIESQIDATRSGPIALNVSLTFFLKILFFKVNLELNSGISFFKDAVHMPMVMHMPVEAKDWLHPGSGAWYSWRLDPKVVKLDVKQSGLPSYSAVDVKKGPQELAKIGLPFCPRAGDQCNYWLQGKIAARDFAMNYRIPRAMVEKGFFPMLSQDLPRDLDAADWDKSDDVDYENRVGIYFDNTGLPKGVNRWEFWIKLGDGNREVCPVPVNALKLISSG